MTKVVVIVEDTESVASSLALAFENIPDVKAVIVQHPKAALRLFTNPDIPIAAVVTDLNLPYMNGFELIGEIRKLAAYGKLPAIMVTADPKADFMNGSPACKPNAIFRKPFSLKEVCRALEKLLG